MVGDNTTQACTHRQTHKYSSFILASVDSIGLCRAGLGVWIGAGLNNITKSFIFGAGQNRPKLCSYTSTLGLQYIAKPRFKPRFGTKDNIFFGCFKRVLRIFLDFFYTVINVIQESFNIDILKPFRSDLTVSLLFHGVSTVFSCNEHFKKLHSH